jgi:hypothetical protein
MTLTLETLLAAKRKIEALGPMPPEIRESTFAVLRSQARVYPKRKAKSLRHHKRMNKKWERRYGFVEKPAAFMLDTRHLMGPSGKQVLFVHPDLMATVRRSLGKEVR